MKNEALFYQRSHRLPCTNSFVHLKQIISQTIQIFSEAAGVFIKTNRKHVSCDMNLNLRFNVKYHPHTCRCHLIYSQNWFEDVLSLLSGLLSAFPFPALSKWFPTVLQLLTAHWEVVWTCCCQLWVFCTGGESSRDRRKSSRKKKWKSQPHETVSWLQDYPSSGSAVTGSLHLVYSTNKIEMKTHGWIEILKGQGQKPATGPPLTPLFIYIRFTERRIVVIT